MSTLVRFPKDTLVTFLTHAFDQIGCASEIYESVVAGLIETSLRGVDSHGVRLLPHYIRAAQNGRVNLRPKFTLQQTSATTATLDADNTYGITAATKGMLAAIDMAHAAGLGCVTVKNSSHFGAASIYGLMAARANMLGLSFTSVDALVFPHGSGKRFLGTNPFCFTAPCAGEEPICLDMATSMISWNKLLGHRATHTAVPENLAVNQQGQSTTDPEQAVGLFPFGSYKGSGIAFMIEVLCTLLTGMPYGEHIPRMYPLDDQKRQLGHFFMAIDIKRFVPIEEFKLRLQAMAFEIRALPTTSGFDKVRVPEDIEKEAFADRTKHGIPLPAEVLADFSKLAAELNIATL